MRSLILVALLGCATSSGRSQPADYDMADLRALARQKSYRELLVHLEDIRPARRDRAWRQMLSTAAVGVLESEADSPNPMGALSAADWLLDAYPQLEADTGFMRRRGELGAQAYKKCFMTSCRRYQGWARDKDWRNALLAFAETDPAHAALPSGKVVMTYLIPEAAFPIFLLAFEHGDPRACRDTDARRSVAAARRGTWSSEAAAVARRV